MDVADAIAAMPEGAERTAAAMDLMGRSGGDMVPLINDGAQAIRDLMQEADDLGLTISEETAAAIQAFDDNMKKLKGSLSGLTNQIVGRLAPALEDISGYIAGLAEKFGQLTPEMQTFVSVLAGLLVVVGPILIGLGLLVTAIGAISAPVLAVIAGIGLLTAALWAFWPTLVSAKDAIVAFVTEGLDRAREAIHNMATAMRDGALQAVAWVKQGFEELMEFFRSLPEQFMEFGRNIITGLWDGLKEKWDAMSNWFSGKVDELLNILPWRAEIQSPSRVMHRQGAYLVEGLDNGIRSGMQAPIDSMRELAETLMSTMDEQDIHRGTMRLADLFEAIIDGSMDAREALGQLLQELAKVQLQKALLGLAGGGGVFGQLAGALGEALTAPSFAGGGYTGRAARVGGLDGQGGFLAIMHPRETVIDHADGLPAGGHVEVVVRVEGGNIVAEIERVSGGVTARAVAAYDRNLSQRVRQINGDRRAV
jgi:phage-related protein